MVDRENPSSMGVICGLKILPVDLDICVGIQTLKYKLEVTFACKVLRNKERGIVDPIIEFILVELKEVVSVIWINSHVVV